MMAEHQAYLPELDDLHRDEQRDGYQVRVQDPVRHHVDEELCHVAGVVTLHDQTTVQWHCLNSEHHVQAAGTTKMTCSEFAY